MLVSYVCLSASHFLPKSEKGTLFSPDVDMKMSAVIRAVIIHTTTTIKNSLNKLKTFEHSVKTSKIQSMFNVNMYINKLFVQKYCFNISSRFSMIKC